VTDLSDWALQVRWERERDRALAEVDRLRDVVSALLEQLALASSVIDIVAPRPWYAEPKDGLEDDGAQGSEPWVVRDARDVVIEESFGEEYGTETNGQSARGFADAVNAIGEPATWTRRPVTHEWERGSTDSRPLKGFVNVELLLTDGWTVGPWVYGFGFPASRPVDIGGNQ
jgi:hypothetical protein